MTLFVCLFCLFVCKKYQWLSIQAAIKQSSLPSLAVYAIIISLLVKPWMQTCSSKTFTQFMQSHKFSFLSERCFQFKACIWAMKQLRWSLRVYISSEWHNKLSIQRSSIKGSYRLLAFICLLGTKENIYSLWTLKSWKKTLNHCVLEASSKSMEYNTILLVYKWREHIGTEKKL